MLRDSLGSTQQESQINKRKRVGKRRKLSEIVKRWEETIEDCARVLPVRGKGSGIQGPCKRAYSGIQGAAGNYPSRLRPLGLGSFLLPGRDHGAIIRV